MWAGRQQNGPLRALVKITCPAWILYPDRISFTVSVKCMFRQMKTVAFSVADIKKISKKDTVGKGKTICLKHMKAGKNEE